MRKASFFFFFYSGTQTSAKARVNKSHSCFVKQICPANQRCLPRLVLQLDNKFD